MKNRYAERKVAEALKEANGNVAKAKSLISEWVKTDVKLLHAMTKSHLNGIIAYHIESLISQSLKAPTKVQSSGVKRAIGESSRAPQKTSPQDLFGTQMLKAMTDTDASIFGLEGYAPQPKRGKASQTHIDAIMQMTRKRS